MKVYQINYDLRNQRNYPRLISKIKTYGAYAKPLESCWVIATDQTSRQVWDNLASVIDADDGLLVTRLQGEATWNNLANDSNGQVTEWLKKQLGQAA